MADRLVEAVAALPANEGRRLIAVAGPPASGKSTLAERLADKLGPAAVLVPMDGFHLDNSVLQARGLLPRKGAPETFDAAGFVAAMRRIKAGGEVILPTFDRSLEKSIAGAIVVPEEAETVVVEGNYLLLDDAPWHELREIWDMSAYLAVDEAELERRLMDRWARYGYSEADARRKTHENDLPNARRTAESRLRADMVLQEESH